MVLSVVSVLRPSVRHRVCAFHRCDCTERLQSKLGYMCSELGDAAVFKSIYRYAFDFARVSLNTDWGHVLL